MNDETKDELMRRTREWLQSCVNAATRSGVPEEADLEAFILAHLDGEPARIAAAREEQREADAKFCPSCLGVGFVERPVPCPYCDDSTHDHYCPTGTQRQQCGCGAERIRGTPLTATPLADRLRDADESARRGWEQADSLHLSVKEWRERVAELEEQAKKDDAHALVVNTLHLKEVAALRGRVAWLEARRDEAVAALRGLLREEWCTYEGNLEASGHASVDDLNTARAVVAKYPEGR